MSKITLDEVRQTALLARLELSDAEVAQLTRELDAILGYMASLSQLDVSNVEPTTHAVPVELGLRADELAALAPQLTVDEALADAPARRGSFFEVPKIIEVGE
jgi:aspartyl-tRNA(Asn)/glutamyl-tRNA(Gln) amidotransferase subunit C